MLLGEIAGTYTISEILAQGDLVRSSALYAPMLVLILLGAFTKSEIGRASCRERV